MAQGPRAVTLIGLAACDEPAMLAALRAAATKLGLRSMQRQRRLADDIRDRSQRPPAREKLPDQFPDDLLAGLRAIRLVGNGAEVRARYDDGEWRAGGIVERAAPALPAMNGWTPHACELYEVATDGVLSFGEGGPLRVRRYTNADASEVYAMSVYEAN